MNNNYANISHEDKGTTDTGKGRQGKGERLIDWLIRFIGPWYNHMAKKEYKKQKHKIQITYKIQYK